MIPLKNMILGFLGRIKHSKREITVEIITITPISIRFCQLDTCDRLGRTFGVDFSRALAEEHSDDIKELYSKVMKLIEILSRKCYVRIHVIEAFTPLGFYKLSRHGGNELPVIIVNGTKIYEGADWDPQDLSEKICSIASSRHQQVI